MRRGQQETLRGLNSGERSNGKTTHDPSGSTEGPPGFCWLSCDSVEAASQEQCSEMPRGHRMPTVGFGKVLEWMRTSQSSFRRFQTHCEQKHSVLGDPGGTWRLEKTMIFLSLGSLTHDLASVSLPFLTGQRGESRCPSHPMKTPALFQACPLVRHASPKSLPLPLARAQRSQTRLLVSGKAQLWLPVGREVTVSATWCLCSLSNLHLPAATSAGPPGKGWGQPFMHLGANRTRKTI